MELKFRLSTLAAIALFGSVAHAEQPRELKTEKGKPVVLANLVDIPSDCSSNPAPIPLPRLGDKPSHGRVVMQLVSADVPATDRCPARKIPGIALFYAPNADFLGTDTLQMEIETSDKTVPVSFRIMVQESI
jgi:hypothetical protein